MEQGFWKKLKKPIIGLAPMDGVTDAPFRLMTAKYGKPDIMMTEFTSVEGISHGNVKGLRAFIFDEIERPIIAQLFGSDPESFYRTAFVVCELGFDGIDINMGCPAKNVASKGSGAALIQTPDVAKEIIQKTQKGVQDWIKGKTMEEAEVPQEITDQVRRMKPNSPPRKELPISIKTRIGYNSNIAEEWVKHLLECKPVNISLHGRTLKQMYTGEANWEAIAQAAKVIKKTETTILGNGDINSVEEGLQRVKECGVDGFLIGRASFGNPWIFQKEPTEIALEQKFQAAIEHSKLYETIIGTQHFMPMRKHLSWYCKGFHNASEIRQKLMKASSAQEVEEVLQYAHGPHQGS